MKALLKEYHIDAPKNKVFEALTTEEMIQAWLGDEAEMNCQPGGEFSLWGGTVFGENIEIGPDRIVQNWQERSWDKPSKVVITLKEKGDTTVLQVLHNGIPDKSFHFIETGWDDDYLRPLKDWVEERVSV